MSRQVRLKLAENDVRYGRLSSRHAAGVHEVARSTVLDHVSGRVDPNRVWGSTPKLSVQEEEDLVSHALGRVKYGLGMTRAYFLRYAAIYAKERGKPFKNGYPSDKWWRLLKKRHPEISLRQPEATCSARHKGMERTRVEYYFKCVQQAMEEADIMAKPDAIWNMDETGLTMSHHCPKVLARKGSRHIQGRVNPQRETITVIGAVNAAGISLPLHTIVPGKTTLCLQAYDTEKAGEGWKVTASDSGWVKEGIVELWFREIFLANIGEQRPQLLLFDGHSTHTGLELLTVARENKIILVEIPSHTSHWLQPLDVSVYKALKSAWHRGCADFTTLTNAPPTKGQFFRTLKEAWAKGVTCENIRSGFRVCGLYPFNPAAIPEEAYMPAETPNPDVNPDDMPSMPEPAIAEIAEPVLSAASSHSEVERSTTELEVDFEFEMPKEGSAVILGEIGTFLPPEEVPQVADEVGQVMATVPTLVQTPTVTIHPTVVRRTTAATATDTQAKQSAKKNMRWDRTQKYFILTADDAFQIKVESRKRKEDNEKKKAERLAKKSKK